MPKSFVLATTLVIASSYVTVAAADDVAEGQNAAPSASQRFAALDDNGDGVLTRDEMAKSAELESHFEDFDASGNGELSLAEFTAGLQDQAETLAENASEFSSDVQEKAADYVEAGVDKAAEFGQTAGDTVAETAEDLRKKTVEGYQTSKDVVSDVADDVSDEMAEQANSLAALGGDLKERFLSLDDNSNRELSQEEAQSDAKVKRSFDALDANEDGVLSASEFSEVNTSGQSQTKQDSGFFGWLFS